MLLIASTPPRPVVWLRPDGAIVVPGREPARIMAGTKTVATPYGVGVDLGGMAGGIFIPDDDRLHLARSITISAWVYLRRFVGMANSSPVSQILFRGDDRDGLDPYHLSVVADGTVVFSIANLAGVVKWVQAPVSLCRWTHLLGSLDDTTGDLKLWIDGHLAAADSTTIRPFARLAINEGPGVSIGNVPAPERGLHNQPMDGILADVRLYDRALVPADLGIRYESPNPRSFE